jgi:MYXO-CTERM domain-containing protein
VPTTTSHPQHAEGASLPAIPHEIGAARFDIILRRLADDLTSGADPSRFVGPGVDFAQSRPWAHGDSVRRIDWRVTARTGKVHVREFEAPKRSGVYIVVDTSASMNVSSVPLTKHDAAVWLAGALALVALRRRSPVCILGAGDREVPTTPTLARGRIWTWIQHLRDPAHHESTRLSERLTQIETIARHTSAIIVLSDLHDHKAIDFLRRLGAMHDVIVLRLTDPAESTPLRAGFLHAGEAETGHSFLTSSRRAIATPKRAQQEAEDLGRARVQLTEVRTDGPIIATVRHALKAHAGTLGRSR